MVVGQSQMMERWGCRN